MEELREQPGAQLAGSGHPPKKFEPQQKHGCKSTVQTFLATPLRATVGIYNNEYLNEPQYALTKIVSKEVHWEIEGCHKKVQYE